MSTARRIEFFCHCENEVDAVVSATADYFECPHCGDVWEIDSNIMDITTLPMPTGMSGSFKKNQPSDGGYVRTEQPVTLVEAGFAEPKQCTPTSSAKGGNNMKACGYAPKRPFLPTAEGVAVWNGKEYVRFDPIYKTLEVVDSEVIDIEFPTTVVPTRTVVVGDFIEYEGSTVIVYAGFPELTIINPATGEKRQVVAKVLGGKRPMLRKIMTPNFNLFKDGEVDSAKLMEMDIMTSGGSYGDLLMLKHMQGQPVPTTPETVAVTEEDEFDNE